MEQTQISETSYAKGRSLEVQFSEFMKSDLGWDSARVGVHLVGKLNRKGATVDVVGQRLTEKGKDARKVSIATAVIAILSGVLFLTICPDLEFLPYMCIFLLIASGIYFEYSKKHNIEHALVECKNLKGKAVSSHIDKTLREKDDYNSSGDTEFKFTNHYFVSANGYVETTLKYALEKGIVCYVKNGDTFEIEKYWK